MEIVAAIITLAVGVLAEATIGISWNMRGVGTLLGVAVMGAFILWAVRNPRTEKNNISHRLLNRNLMWR